MQLLNLTIDRIIIHQIYRRDENGNKVTPTQSHEYTIFDQSAMQEFKSRVKDALGDGSKAVEMEIVNQESGDLPPLVDIMTDQDNESFIVSSFDIAKKLSDAQQMKSIPGGIVVIFTGKQGAQQKKFLGIIKAEIHSAYEKSVNPETHEISLKFVEEVLLTPGTRLYKTAGFYEKLNYVEPCQNLRDKWTVMVSDYQIGKSDGKAAAQYFYSDFLGCGYPETSARTTKQFYELTCKFITTLAVPAEKRNDLLNALTTYLKVDTSSTVSSSDFASTYFDVDTQDEFSEYIEAAGLPTGAFTKDTTYIKSNLKLRKVKFGSNVKITGPSEAFKNLVTIDTIDGDLDESGMPAEWTRVIIKDRISKQE